MLEASLLLIAVAVPMALHSVGQEKTFREWRGRVLWALVITACVVHLMKGTAFPFTSWTMYSRPVSSWVDLVARYDDGRTESLPADSIYPGWEHSRGQTALLKVALPHTWGSPGNAKCVRTLLNHLITYRREQQPDLRSLELWVVTARGSPLGSDSGRARLMTVEAPR